MKFSNIKNILSYSLDLNLSYVDSLNSGDHSRLVIEKEDMVDLFLSKDKIVKAYLEELEVKLDSVIFQLEDMDNSNSDGNFRHYTSSLCHFIYFVSKYLGFDYLEKNKQLFEKFKKLKVPQRSGGYGYYSGMQELSRVVSMLSYYLTEEDCLLYINCEMANQKSSWNPEYSILSAYMRSYYLKDSDKAKDFVRDTVDSANFSTLSYKMRSCFYCAVISSGSLTKQIARKIRSDASENVSCDAVRELFRSKDLYDNFNELVVKFADTRYSAVSRVLAEKLDKKMLTSLLGCNHHYTKQIISRRLSQQ